MSSSIALSSLKSTASEDRPLTVWEYVSLGTAIFFIIVIASAGITICILKNRSTKYVPVEPKTEPVGDKIQWE